VELKRASMGIEGLSEGAGAREASCPRALCQSCSRRYSGWGLVNKKICECGGKLVLQSPYSVLCEGRKPTQPSSPSPCRYTLVATVAIWVYIAGLYLLGTRRGEKWKSCSEEFGMSLLSPTVY